MFTIQQPVGGFRLHMGVVCAPFWWLCYKASKLRLSDSTIQHSTVAISISIPISEGHSLCVIRYVPRGSLVRVHHASWPRWDLDDAHRTERHGDGGRGVTIATMARDTATEHTHGFGLHSERLAIWQRTPIPLHHQTPPHHIGPAFLLLLLFQLRYLLLPERSF